MKISMPIILTLIVLSQNKIYSMNDITKNLDLDDILKQMASELPPEEKKQNKPNPPIPAYKEEQESSPAWLQELQKPLEKKSKKRSTQVFKSENKLEQKIMTLFKNKIVPIADGLLKLVESKETQQLVETAKKKRLEYEKTVATKAGKGSYGKSRYASVGSKGGSGSSGHSDWGSSNKWSGGHSGLGGRNDWSPSSSPKPFGSESTSHTEADTKSGLDKSDNETMTTDSDSGGTYPATPRDEASEREHAKNMQAVNALSTTVTSNLSEMLTKLNASKTLTDKNTVFDDLKRLKEKFDARREELYNLPPAEQNAIKAQEKVSWNNLIATANAFEADCHQVAAAVQHSAIKDITPAILHAQNILHDGGNNGTDDISADPLKGKFETLQKNLAALPAKSLTQKLTGIQAQITKRLTTLNALPDAGTIDGNAPTQAELPGELEAFTKTNFLGAENTDFINEIKAFLTPTPDQPDAQQQAGQQIGGRIGRRK